MMSSNSSHSDLKVSEIVYDESTSGESDNGESSGPDTETLEAYDAIMRSRLPSIPPVDLPWLTAASARSEGSGVVEKEAEEEREDEKFMSKAQKQNAKKKRRKERERAMKQMIDEQLGGTVGAMSKEIVKDEPAIPFRLFSSTPVRPITLKPAKEDYVLPVNPRHIPLPHDVLDRIRAFAQSSAAAWEDTSSTLIPPQAATSSTPFDALSKHAIQATQNQTIHLQPSPHPIPNIITILPESSTSSLPMPKSQSKSSHFSSAIPKLHRVEPTLPPIKLSQRQRRRIIQSQPYPVQASFWAPKMGLGGKAGGYAYGYRGSGEGRRETGWGYVRS